MLQTNPATKYWCFWFRNDTPISFGNSYVQITEGSRDFTTFAQSISFDVTLRILLLINHELYLDRRFIYIHKGFLWMSITYEEFEFI